MMMLSRCLCVRFEVVTNLSIHLHGEKLNDSRFPNVTSLVRDLLLVVVPSLRREIASSTTGNIVVVNQSFFSDPTIQLMMLFMSWPFSRL